MNYTFRNYMADTVRSKNHNRPTNHLMDIRVHREVKLLKSINNTVLQKMPEYCMYKKVAKFMIICTKIKAIYD